VLVFWLLGVVIGWPVTKVVTEWGVAELHGRSIRERARSLIAIAHPDHRDHLALTARGLGYC
jgi:acyl-CoA hydrolase